MSSGKNANNAPSDKQATKMGGPWQPLQAPYEKLVKQIQGGSKKPWEYGPDVVQDFDPLTSGGIAAGGNIASAGNPAFQQATDFAGGVASGGYVGNTPGMAGINNTAENGVNNPAYESLMRNLELANKGSGGLDYAQGAAGGKYIGSNPQLDQVINDTLGDVNRTLLPSLEGRMAMNGRLGSNAEAVGQGEIAKKLGEVATGIRYGDYNTERGRQQEAGLALPGLLGSELAARSGAAGDVTGEAYRADATRRDAAGQAADIQDRQLNTAMNGGTSLGNNFENQFIGADKSIQYGGLNQGQAERQAMEEQEKFRYNQSAKYDNINRQLGQYGQIAGVTNPAAANAAYAQSLTRPSGFQTGVGNLMGLAGAGAQIGSMFFDPTSTTSRVLGAVGGQMGAPR